MHVVRSPQLEEPARPSTITAARTDPDDQVLVMSRDRRGTRPAGMVSRPTYSSKGAFSSESTTDGAR
jgi:hypothetical protein